MRTANMRYVIVSNRLPIVIEASAQGHRVRPASGGLVTALSAFLHRSGGTWIGWPGDLEAGDGAARELLREGARSEGFDLVPVHLSAEDRRGFYEGFSNEIIWPLFHDFQSRCNFVPDYWTAYLRVIDQFAEVVRSTCRPDDFVWIQDYHLMGLGQRLRELGVRSRLGFFLHIPFPPPQIFAKLPWRTDVLAGLLDYGVVGFQTPDDLENFVDCLDRYVPDAVRRLEQRRLVVRRGRQAAVCGAFPIGIDSAEFESLAGSAAAVERRAQIRADVGGQQILLGIDRLDYTKGILYRLRAFRRALERFPKLHRQVTYLQVVVPSREGVREYQDLLSEIEQQVSQLNGAFAQPGWTPVQYLFRSLDRQELVGYYRAADVALVTPLKDGMNLVAKEFCACQVDGDGVLILSEFAGAATQLDVGAILVNPFDVDRVAESIARAVLLTPEQRRTAMRRLRRSVRRFDVHWWVGRFLAAAASGNNLVHPDAAGLERTGTA